MKPDGSPDQGPAGQYGTVGGSSALIPNTPPVHTLRLRNTRGTISPNPRVTMAR